MRGSRSPYDTPEVDELVGHVERGDFAAAERFLETRMPWAYAGAGAFRAARRAARAA